MRIQACICTSDSCKLFTTPPSTYFSSNIALVPVRGTHDFLGESLSPLKKSLYSFNRFSFSDAANVIKQDNNNYCQLQIVQWSCFSSVVEHSYRKIMKDHIEGSTPARKTQVCSSVSSASVLKNNIFTTIACNLAI